MIVIPKSLCRMTIAFEDYILNLISKPTLTHKDNKSSTLPAELPSVWSNIGPVPYEAVDPWFLVQSKSSSGNWVHRHKDRSKLHLYGNKNKT